MKEKEYFDNIAEAYWESMEDVGILMGLSIDELNILKESMPTISEISEKAGDILDKVFSEEKTSLEEHVKLIRKIDDSLSSWNEEIGKLLSDTIDNIISGSIQLKEGAVH